MSQNEKLIINLFIGIVYLAMQLSSTFATHTICAHFFKNANQITFLIKMSKETQILMFFLNVAHNRTISAYK